jgi:hypothetical protein
MPSKPRAAARCRLDLYKAARCLDVAKPEACTKVEVFFVTGRTEREHKGEKASAWTIRNLLAADYRDVSRDRLYMRDPGTRPPPALRSSRQGYTIIANIGDQDSDLAGYHAERTFKVPNPFYFIR